MHFGRALLLLFSSIIIAAVVANNFSVPLTGRKCKQRPRKLIKSAKICCAVPEPHFESFIEKCPSLGANATIYCQLECLFNASQALEVQNLNLAKLHKLLDQVFPDAIDFVAAYYISYEECIPLVKKALKDRAGIKHKCDPTALIYAACAQMKLLKHCPANAWNRTEACEEARSYVLECEHKLLLNRRRSTRLKYGETYQMKVEKEDSNNVTLEPKIDVPIKAPNETEL